MGRSCVAARGAVPPGIPPLIRRRHSRHSAFQRRRWDTWHRPVHASQRHLLQPADAWQWRTVRRSNPGRSQGQLRMLIPLLWITASQSTAVNIKPVCVDTRLSTHSTTEQLQVQEGSWEGQWGGDIQCDNYFSENLQYHAHWIQSPKGCDLPLQTCQLA